MVQFTFDQNVRIFSNRRAGGCGVIEGLKSYPVRKDSGVAWLGRVPAHWEVVPAAAAYRPWFRKNTGMQASTVLSLSYGNIVVRPAEKLRGLVPESFETYQVVEPGDLIVRTTDLQNDRKSLRVGYSRSRGIITAAYLCLGVRGRSVPEYGYALLDAYDHMKVLYGYGSGLRQSLSFQDIKGVPVLVPPREEQESIIRFLHHSERRVRGYIRAKQKLVGLLEEQKRAVIHSAVTRGLDSGVRLKSSGVGWLGEVPEHWEVVRNKTVCRTGTGHTPSRNVAEYWVDCDTPWFTLSDVHQIRGDKVKYVYETKERVSQVGLANSAAVKLPRGTVILSRTASVGYSAILGCEMATSQDFMAWVPGERVLSEYLLAVLRAMRSEFNRLMYGSTHNTIYMPALHALQMPLPPRAEQAAIASHIDAAIGPIDIALARTRRALELLREYRTRLIADVVTGKLDVREAAARLPDDSVEPEPAEHGEPMHEEAGDAAELELAMADDE